MSLDKDRATQNGRRMLALSALMKINFTNFGRGALIENRALVSEKYDRKPAVLYFYEVLQFLAAVLFAIVSYNLCTDDGWGDQLISFVLSSMIAVLFLGSAFFMATDNWMYSPLSLIAGVMLVLFAVALGVENDFNIGSWLIMLIAFAYMIPLVMNRACKKYYLWCKSIA